MKRGVYPAVIYPDIAREIREARDKLAERCGGCACRGPHRAVRDAYLAYFPGAKIIKSW
jgi:hypothetical protein